MPSRERIIRGASAAFGARLVEIAANAALTVILARFLLTTDQFGRLFVAISVIGVASILGTLGIPSSVARYVTEYDEKDPAQVPHVVRTSLLAIVVLCGAVGLGLVLGAEAIARVLGDPALAPLLLLGAFYVVGYSLAKFARRIFQALNRLSVSAVLSSISSIGRLVLAVGLVWAGLGPAGALLGYVGGFALASIVGLWLLYTRCYAGVRRASSMESGLARRLLEYSVPLTATRSAAILDKKVDTILVGALAGATPAAFYVVGKQISDACTAPASSLGYAISPAIGEERAGDRLDRAARHYEASLEHVIVLYVPAVVGLVVLAEPAVVLVFGPAYLGAVPVVQVLAVFIFAAAINAITSGGLDFLGRASDRAKAKSAMAVGNVVLNLALIPVLGVVGAAIATVCTYSLYTLYNVRVIGQELPIDLRRRVGPLLRVLAISVLMGLVVFELRPFIDDLTSLVGVVAIGLAIWAIPSATMGLVDPAKFRSGGDVA